MFTLRPTFLVLDSDNSLAFATLPHYFDMPLVVLMSPQVEHVFTLISLKWRLAGQIYKI